MAEVEQMIASLSPESYLGKAARAARELLSLIKKPAAGMLMTTLITAAIAVPAAVAQPAMSGADLLVDLDQFVGKEVILTGVEVYGADNDGALVQSAGLASECRAKGLTVKLSATSSKTIIRLAPRQNAKDGCL